jgi:hypothetical protein
LLEVASQEFIEVTEGGLLELERARVRQENPDVDLEEIKSVRLSMRGARGLFPHCTLPLLGSTFRVPVEAVEEFSVKGIRFVRLRISPLSAEEDAVGMWLYVAPPVLGNYDPQIGDEVEGTAWIQGTLISRL